MTDIYADPANSERAMNLMYQIWHHLVIDLGLGWDMTHAVSAFDGRACFGDEYNQQSVIWSIPAALEDGDAAAPCAKGHLVYDMLKAVRECE